MHLNSQFKLTQKKDNSNDRPTGPECRELRWSDINVRREASYFFLKCPYKFVLFPLAPCQKFMEHVPPPADGAGDLVISVLHVV